MKFLLFNIVVIAALGYMAYERGSLDSLGMGEPPDNSAGAEPDDRLAAVGQTPEPAAAKPIEADPVTDTEPVQAAPVRASVSSATTARVTAAPVRDQSPAAAAAPGNDAAEPTGTVRDNPRETDNAPLKSAGIKAPVRPEVAARRAVVLGQDSEANRTDEMPAGERRRRLQDLAEEMDILSVTLIHR